MKHIVLAAALITCLSGVLSCGQKSTSDRLLGTWELEGVGKIEFKADGTVQAEDEPDVMSWEIIESDPPQLEIAEVDDPDDIETFVLVFVDEDTVLIAEREEGMTLTRATD